MSVTVQKFANALRIEVSSVKLCRAPRICRVNTKTWCSVSILWSWCNVSELDLPRTGTMEAGDRGTQHGRVVRSMRLPLGCERVEHPRCDSFSCMDSPIRASGKPPLQLFLVDSPILRTLPLPWTTTYYIIPCGFSEKYPPQQQLTTMMITRYHSSARWLHSPIWHAMLKTDQNPVT